MNINKAICDWFVAIAKMTAAVAAVIAALALSSCVEWAVEPYDFEDLKGLIMFLNSLN